MRNIEMKKDRSLQKHDYEILFNDSPEYFAVENAKIVFEGNMVRFICFSEDNTPKWDEWYPLCRIHRIRRYA